MKKSKQLRALAQTPVALVIAAMAMGALASALYSAEPAGTAPDIGSASSQTNSIESVTNSPDAKPVVVKTEISGAELYSMHCNRCHPERYPTERTAAQWKTIMLHMQVRANIPAGQARQILKYLQDNSGR
jgi:cytochrome c5